MRKVASSAAPMVPASWREDDVVAGRQDLAVEGDVGLAAGVEVARQVAGSCRSNAASIRARSAEVARSAARAAAAGSMTRRASRSERTRAASKVPQSRCQASSSGSSRFQLSRAAHDHAQPRPRLDQALGGEEADRLAQGGAADLVALAQLGLVGQAAAGRPAALEDAQPQAADHLAMDAGADRQAGHASPARRSCRSWIITATISKAPLAISW